MDAFSPIPATIGGLLIGLASAMLWLANGRIAGISGLFGQLLPPATSAVWRLAFLATMVVGALAASYLIPGLGVGGPAGEPARLADAPAGSGLTSAVWLAVAGLLTGFGTKLANGCTSGHGICGLARLSRRSIVSVAIFFGVAIATVAVTGVV